MQLSEELFRPSTTFATNLLLENRYEKALEPCSCSALMIVFFYKTVNFPRIHSQKEQLIVCRLYHSDPTARSSSKSIFLSFPYIDMNVRASSQCSPALAGSFLQDGKSLRTCRKRQWMNSTMNLMLNVIPGDTHEIRS